MLLVGTGKILFQQRGKTVFKGAWLEDKMEHAAHIAWATGADWYRKQCADSIMKKADHLDEISGLQTGT